MVYNNKIRFIDRSSTDKDRGDLSQTLIVISGLSLAVVVGAGAIASVSMDKGGKCSYMYCK